MGGVAAAVAEEVGVTVVAEAIEGAGETTGMEAKGTIEVVVGTGGTTATGTEGMTGVAQSATILGWPGMVATTGANGVTAAETEAMMGEGRAGTMGTEATIGADGVGAVVAGADGVGVVVAEAVEEAGETGAVAMEAVKEAGVEGVAVADTRADSQDMGGLKCLISCFFSAAKTWKNGSSSSESEFSTWADGAQLS